MSPQSSCIRDNFSNRKLVRPRHSCARVDMSLRWPTLTFCTYFPIGTSVREQSPLLCIIVRRSEGLTTFLFDTCYPRASEPADTCDLHMLCSKKMVCRYISSSLCGSLFSMLLQSAQSSLSPELVLESRIVAIRSYSPSLRLYIFLAGSVE
jgi:hypothetical protein